MNTLGAEVQTMGAYDSEGGTGFVVRGPTRRSRMSCRVVWSRPATDHEQVRARADQARLGLHASDGGE
jgi:hypothetical protein